MLVMFAVLVRPAVPLSALAATLSFVNQAHAADMPLRSAVSGLCLAVAGDATTLGATLVQSACTAPSARWRFVATGASFRLADVRTGLCAEVVGGSRAEGIPAQTDKCNGSQQQLFNFRARGAAWEVVVEHSGKCLAPEGGATQSQARIVQQTCNGAAAQRWATRTDAAAISRWGPLVTVGMVPVAAAHRPDGKLVFWSAYDPFTLGGDHGRTYTTLFDPATGQASPTLVTETGHDMFCPGIANLPDGRIHVSGGSSSQKTSIYDPATHRWSAASPLNIPRGYQGSVTLASGNVLTWGGSWSGGTGGKTGEVWSTAGWRLVPALANEPLLTADARGVYRADNHGWFFAAADDRVFHAGPSRSMHWADTKGGGAMTAAGTRAPMDQMNGTATMFDAGRIIVLGGAPSYDNSQAIADARVIDIRSASPAVKVVAPMAYARVFHNSVVLPTGQVVTVGGQAVAVPFSDDLSVLVPELWDPRDESFTPLAQQAVPRVYHSMALLLPDGRVLSGGGGLCGTCPTNHPDVQILTPPYLLNPDGTAALQPRITSAPASAVAGTSISVLTDRAVGGFAFVRMSSVTHSVNNEQRRLPLASTTVQTGSYMVALPPDRGELVPGYWMLFAMSPNGVPSIAAIVRVQ